jgi:UDP-3-O-[3-hydroxymyristoyl] glucosamine N-acyltransferase
MEIAEYLNKQLVGEDFLLKSPRHILTPDSLGRLPRLIQEEGKILLIANQPHPEIARSGYIFSDTPELDLAYVLREFFAIHPIHQVHPTAVVFPEAQLGRNVMVGPHSVIGPEAIIGDNSRILSKVIINGPVTIGKFCVIKDGAVIGSEGWGFVKDEEGGLFHPPQLGRIIIEDRVWIGANTTIERAMLDDTFIGAEVKIDDLVHIGGRSHIGEKSEITAGAIIASNIVMGKNVRIAPNAVLRENITVGDDVLVGQGAVVINDLAAGKVYVGSPARFLREKTSGGVKE